MTNRILILAVALTTAVAPYALSQKSAFSDDDKTFLKDSTQDNLAEIKTAQLVIKTSKNPEVTKFAQKMIVDHRALITSAKPIAAQAGVTPPTSPSMAADADYLKLKVLSGDSFDKAYVKSMVSDHHDDLDKINKENSSTQNAAMKKLTTHAAKVVEGHKEMIDAMASKMGAQ